VNSHFIGAICLDEGDSRIANNMRAPEKKNVTVISHRIEISPSLSIAQQLLDSS
jgi:hypothetical protein